MVAISDKADTNFLTVETTFKRCNFDRDLEVCHIFWNYFGMVFCYFGVHFLNWFPNESISEILEILIYCVYARIAYYARARYDGEI